MGVPKISISRLLRALEENMKGNNGHLDTGIFGTQFFFEILSENGMHDLAYEAMNKKEEPGYGSWLDTGCNHHLGEMGYRRVAQPSNVWRRVGVVLPQAGRYECRS
jgi:hypothetical protein